MPAPAKQGSANWSALRAKLSAMLLEKINSGKLVLPAIPSTAARVLECLEANSHQERAAKNRHVLVGRMRVRRDFVAIRHLQADREGFRLARIADEDRELRALRQERRPVHPLHGGGRRHDARRRQHRR